MEFASISPSNIGMPKLSYILKAVAPPEWLLGEDVSLVGSHPRIWEKLSIIVFLCHSMASLRNILKGSPTHPLSFLLPWEAVVVCETGLAKVQSIRALTTYTLTLFRTCKGQKTKSRLL